MKTNFRRNYFTNPILAFYQAFFVRHRHTFPSINDIFRIVVWTFFEAPDQHQIYTTTEER